MASAKRDVCIQLRLGAAPQPCRGPANTQTQPIMISPWLSAGFVTEGQLDPHDVTP